MMVIEIKKLHAAVATVRRVFGFVNTPTGNWSGAGYYERLSAAAAVGGFFPS